MTPLGQDSSCMAPLPLVLQPTSVVVLLLCVPATVVRTHMSGPTHWAVPNSKRMVQCKTNVLLQADAEAELAGADAAERDADFDANEGAYEKVGLCPHRFSGY